MSKKHVLNKDLPVIKEGFPGNLQIDGEFTNGNEKDQASFKAVLRWMLSPNPQKKEKAKDDYKPEVKRGEDFLHSDEDMIVWLGHASFFIRIAGVTILTDPVFFSMPFVPRRVGIPYEAGAFKGIDYVLLSHCHRDHLDIKTLNIILANNPLAEFLVPLNAGKILKKLKHKFSIQEAGWYQQFKTKDKLSIDFLPAKHWNRRGLSDFNQELWGSFMLKRNSDGKTIYFAGDTAYAQHFKDIQKLGLKTDIVLMPIGAYKPAYLMQLYHMDPQQAFQAYQDLQADKFIPMHFGTFDLSNEPAGEPLRQTISLFKENNLSDKLITPAIGKEVNI
jgi:L-ascorbate metabolism protein UlaG (beta-lactamase superfamily)